MTLMYMHVCFAIALGRLRCWLVRLLKYYELLSTKLTAPKEAAGQADVVQLWKREYPSNRINYTKGASGCLSEQRS